MSDYIKERKWVWIFAIIIAVASSIPYLWGMWIEPNGSKFLGLTHNIDDGAVYLSWMRQAADGHFFIKNLFTNDMQTPRQFNILFLIMGLFAKVSYLKLITVYHLFRLGFGIALIISFWKFTHLFLKTPFQRKLAVFLLGVSSGIGWLIPGAAAPNGSVDIWQPEAITFLSMYLNPLFIIGLILMIWSMYYLVLMHRTGEMRHAVSAGLVLLLLGNIHTYDVITVGFVWLCYVILCAALERQFPKKLIVNSLIAALIASLSVAYQFHVFSIDEVYRLRVNTPATSPSVLAFFMGYGLVLIGAVIGAYYAYKSSGKKEMMILILWSLLGFILPYFPAAQQRKLVMGLHIPLCMLCSFGLCVILSKMSKRIAFEVVAIFIFLAMQSNLKFMMNDIKLLNNYATATHYVPYISMQELKAMDYIKSQKSDSVIFAPPTFALFTPAFTGKSVYYGHWSETPDYSEKIGDWINYTKQCEQGMPDLEFVKNTGSDYLVIEEQADEKCNLALKKLDMKPIFADEPVFIYNISKEYSK